MEPQEIRTRLMGWLCLTIWGALILLGMIAKRMFGHADWMMFFHLPAAVFLVLAFYHLSEPVRAKHRRYRANFKFEQPQVMMRIEE